MAGSPLFKFKQGDHICVFYDDEPALLDLLVPFFIDGLQKNERCFTAQTPSLAKGLVNGLRSAGVDIDAAIKRGAFEIQTTEQFYGPDIQSFDPKLLMRLLQNFVLESVYLGYTGSRTAGEMQFAANKAACAQLVEYEALVDAAFPGRPVLGICQYNTRRFAPELLDQVLALHRKAVSETMATSNHSSLTIRKGRYLIDIVADRMNPRNQFYYVAQEQGKKDILGWGVEPDIDAAILNGESLLDSLQHAAD